MPITKQLIHNEIVQAIVKIFVYDEFQGTGFFISPDYILTAFHCIKTPIPGDIKIELNETPTKKIVAKFNVEKSLENLDIAVLQVANYQSPYYLPLGLVNENHTNHELVSPGYPGYRLDNQGLGLYCGRISRLRGDYIEND